MYFTWHKNLWYNFFLPLGPVMHRSNFHLEKILLFFSNSCSALPLRWAWKLFHTCLFFMESPRPYVSPIKTLNGYDKQCCNEHWGARVSFRSGFLSVYAQKWDCWVIWQFYFQFPQMSISRQMDKEAVVHIHHGILLSH